MKKIVLFLVILSSVWAVEWENNWHDSDGTLWPFRNQINLTSQSISSLSDESISITLDFSGVFPYCEDVSGDGHLKANNTDLVSLRVAKDSDGTLKSTSFEIASFTCISNELRDATIRFRADLPGMDEDLGFGDGTSRYWIFFSDKPRLLLTDETDLPEQTAAVTSRNEGEQRKLLHRRESWDEAIFRWRLCLSVENSEDFWIFNTTTTESITFPEIKPYCDDINSDSVIESGEGGTLRVVQELEDGSLVEIPLLITSANCLDNELMTATLTFNHFLPPSDNAKLWLYLDNYTLEFPSYQHFSDQPPLPFTRSFCAELDGPGCPSKDYFFDPGACCSGYHYWELDHSHHCKNLCESLGFNFSIMCCGNKPGQYFIGSEWACMDGEVCFQPVDFDEDGAPFGDPDDTCGCNLETDQGKPCDSNADGIWDGFCVDEDCVPCSESFDFICPDLRCLGIDPDCCDAEHPCLPGFICNLTENRCISPVGELCLTNADCLADTICRKNICVATKFAFFESSRLGLFLGEQAVVFLEIRDPQGRPATYRLRFGGPGRHFAKFHGLSGELDLLIRPNEIKRVPVYITGGQLGDFDLELVAYDIASMEGGTPQIMDTETLSFNVEGRMPRGLFISAPGLSKTHLFAIIPFSLVIFWKKNLF